MVNIACCGIIEKDKEILITKRKINPFINKYVLPGGKLDYGERLKECLKREILEEVGLIVTDSNFFDYYEVILPERYYLIMYFICKVENYNLKINDDEISDYKWIGYSNYQNFDIAPGSKKIIKEFFNDCNS